MESPQGVPPGVTLTPIGGGTSSEPPPQNVPQGISLTPIGGPPQPPPQQGSTPPQSSDDGTDDGRPANISAEVWGTLSPSMKGFVKTDGGFAQGTTKNLAQVGDTVMRAAKHILPDVVGNSTIFKHAQDVVKSAADAPLEGVNAKAGYLATDLATWGLGEEKLIEMASGLKSLIKAGSYADKIKAIQPVLKFAEAHPIAGRVIYAALRNAGMGGAMAAAHGADAGDTAKAAGLNAVVGGGAQTLAEGVGAVARAIKPSTAEIAGETVPVLASQKPGASPTSASIASISSEPKIAAAQQAGSQRAMGTMAQQSARNALDDLNEARQTRWDAGEKDFNGAPEEQGSAAAPNRTLGNGQARLNATNPSDAAQLGAGEPGAGVARTNELGAHEGDFTNGEEAGEAGGAQSGAPSNGAGKRKVSYIEERPANFQPIDVDKETEGIGSYKDAAEKVREHARPIYQRLDQATGGKFGELRQQLSSAYEDQDYAKVRETENSIDDLLQTTKNKVDATDYKAAKNAWRTSKVLDAAHSAVSRAFNITDEGLAKDAGVWRGISGGKLQTGINRLVERYGRGQLNQVLGAGALENLTKIADLTQSPRNAQMYGQVVGDVADQMLGGAKRAGLVPSTLDFARRAVLHAAATNPDVAKYIEYAVKNNVSSKVSAPLIAATINQTLSTKRDEQPQEEQK